MNGTPRDLPLAEMKKVISHLFIPNPWIYWTDFLLTCFLAWGCFVAVSFLEPGSLLQALAFLVSSFALYRGVLFIHEVSHRDRKDLPGFSLAWNLMVGIPVLFPSFMYRGVHTEHHRRASYGTKEDGEYIPFGASPFWKSVVYVLQSAYLPVVVAIRFAILTPVSFLHPKLRRMVMLQFSALAIQFSALRKIPTGIDLRNWYVQEILCWIHSWILIAVFATGTLNLGILLQIYLTMVLLFVVNSIRTVVAHRYRNLDGEMTFADQLLDSVNVEGGWLTSLWAPVGLRFHGLHHVFPLIPYHSLATAHRALLQKLPADALYRKTVEPTLLAAIGTLWRNTQESTMHATPRAQT